MAVFPGRRLKHGLFDGLFLADVLGAYDVYGGMQTPATAYATALRNPKRRR
jgi:hypothetical protein